ncbi:peptide ABC transporter [Actinomadura sp. NBRC 104412]|uniref:ABC transporter permease n=1 Tax=Actinomadura sp. NBRC 104412 TaxID=3032203 RepID=UPI0024A5CD26|nr:ABC transporter permease [Actinomadura sp. NBRC 104412]GLZ05629.1 peptide ABC transporter [Actinomadura sp. NBRC 104412]
MTAVVAKRRTGDRGIWAQMLRSPAVRLVVKRLLLAIPIMLGVTILTFWVINLIPGNPAQALLGPEATPDQIRAMEIQMGLDRPAHERYLEWLGGAVQGDLGTSLINRQPVATQIVDRLAVTGELVTLTLVGALACAVPLALVAARRPGGPFDRLVTVVNVTGLSMANYVLALLLVLVFSVTLGVLPAIGFVPLTESVGRNLSSMVLPSVALGFPLMCVYTRFLRADLVDQMQGQDYVVTARAKGVNPWQVLVRHALRNSSYGLIALVGLNMGTLIGVTVIIEQIFALPGTGQLLLSAINSRDVVLIQGVVVFFAVVTVLGNLAADLLQTVLDPRIRYGDR